MGGKPPLILFLLPTCWGISVAIGKVQRVALPNQGIFGTALFRSGFFSVDLSSFESLTSKVVDPQHSLVLVAMLSWLVAPSFKKAPRFADVGVVGPLVKEKVRNHLKQVLG